MKDHETPSAGKAGPSDPEVQAVAWPVTADFNVVKDAMRLAYAIFQQTGVNRDAEERWDDMAAAVVGLYGPVRARPDRAVREALKLARARIAYYGQISDRRHFDHDLKVVFPVIDSALTAEAQRDGAYEECARIAETFFFNDIGRQTRGPSLQDGIATAIRAAAKQKDGG